MYWQMELPIIDMATAIAKCNPGVENYHVYDRCYIIGSQDVGKLICLLWFCVRESTCM